MREYKRPLFTQRHYEDMAFELKNYQVESPVKTEIELFLIEVFSKDNYKFDVSRFKKAMED